MDDDRTVYDAVLEARVLSDDALARRRSHLTALCRISDEHSVNRRLLEVVQSEMDARTWSRHWNAFWTREGVNAGHMKCLKPGRTVNHNIECVCGAADPLDQAALIAEEEECEKGV